jgi:Ca-activated chloride channel family protein
VLALLLLPRLLVGLGLGAAILALARPVQEETVQRTEVHGTNLVIAVDVSESMETPDLPPTRLQAAQHVAQQFVEGLRADRVGLVVFAEAAFVLAPLTLDYGHIHQALGSLSTRMMPKKGTALGEALGLSLLLLDTAATQGGGAVILLTDGAHNRGELGPRATAHLAGQRGVRVYPILVGQDTMQRTLPGGNTLPQPTECSPETLQEVARLSGGAYFTATQPGALAQVLAQVARLEKQAVGTRYERITRERFPLYLLWAVGLLAAGVLLFALGLANPLLD